jgi:hypothetical protein
MNLPPLGKVFWFCGTNEGNPQDCVDWAVRALSQEVNSQSVVILAGLCPPFNCFEVKDYAIRSLKELDIKQPTGTDAVLAYARDLAEDIIQMRGLLRENLDKISHLSQTNGYLAEIFDFYLLSCAYSGLEYQDYQYDWPEAKKENIDEIIINKCQEYIKLYDENHLIE